VEKKPAVHTSAIILCLALLSVPKSYSPSTPPLQHRLVRALDIGGFQAVQRHVEALSFRAVPSAAAVTFPDLEIGESPSIVVVVDSAVRGGTCMRWLIGVQERGEVGMLNGGQCVDCGCAVHRPCAGDCWVLEVQIQVAG
jgi:hypothetical protein